MFRGSKCFDAGVERYRIMNLHDHIQQELLDSKSIAALIWLIEQGRELEFTYQDETCFISCDKSARYVSLWCGKNEQSFETTEHLVREAVLNGKHFLDAWADIRIDTLF